MPTLNLNDENFSDHIDSKSIAIIDIWAEWCAPCKRFAPIFEKVSEEYPDVLFVKVDAEKSPQILQGLGIRGIPSVVAKKNYYFVYSQAGIHTEQSLRGLIEKLQNMESPENFALPVA